MDDALGGDGGGSQGSGGGVSPALGLDLGGDSVQVPPALTGQAAPAVLILFHDLQSLERLKIMSVR